MRPPFRPLKAARGFPSPILCSFSENHENGNRKIVWILSELMWEPRAARPRFFHKQAKFSPAPPENTASCIRNRDTPRWIYPLSGNRSRTRFGNRSPCRRRARRHRLFSGETIVVLDQNDRILLPEGITYIDTRNIEEWNRLAGRIDPARLYALTGKRDAPDRHGQSIFLAQKKSSPRFFQGQAHPVRG